MVKKSNSLHQKLLLKVPANGFVTTEGVYVSPSENPENVDVLIDPNSDRLQKLEPFSSWDGNDFTELNLIFKSKGKMYH